MRLGTATGRGRGATKGSGRARGLALALLLLAAALPAMMPVAAAAIPAACDLKGPDAHRYWCAPAAYAWLDTSGGTVLDLADDGRSDPIVLPFTFPWYGAEEVAVYVGSNGLLCFKSADCGDLNPAALPSAGGPDEVVACFWEDLNPSVPGAVVRHRTVGESPDRVFVVEFNAVPHYGHSGLNTFQLQLLEDGEARCMYQGVVDDNDNVPTAVGAENATGLDGVRFAHGALSGSSVGVRFFPCDACGAPSAPRSLASRAGPGGGQISLTWEAPAQENGFPVIGYKVYRQGSLVAQVTGTSYVDCCFGSGSVLQYQVRAVNNAGEGPSASIDGRPPGPPGPPQGLTTRGGPGAGQLSLSWRAPLDDGGFAVQAFRIYRTPPGGWESFIAQVSPSQLTFTDCCFGAGSRLLYRVSALNNFGEGQSTPQVEAFAPTVPSPPQALGAERGPGAGEIALRWSAPGSDGGVAVQSYRVYGGNVGGPLQLLATVGASGPSFTDRSLPEGALRQYRIGAVNAVGEGSPTTLVQQRAPTRPGAPLDLVAQGGPGLGQVQLAWRAPADLGGVALREYALYQLRGDGPVLLDRVGPGTTTFVHGNASLVAVGHYLVRAVNAVGEGAASNHACAAPAPWGQVDPLAGEPCPAPQGWEERSIVRVVQPVGGDQATPPVDADLVSVDGQPRSSDPNTYDLNVRVLGQALPRISLFNNGLLQSAMHAELLHLPPLAVPLERYTVELDVAARQEPTHVRCFAEVGDTCGAQLPNVLDAAWLGSEGQAGHLIVRARVRGEDGRLVSEQVLALPFAGLVAAGAPAPPAPPVG